MKDDFFNYLFEADDPEEISNIDPNEDNTENNNEDTPSNEESLPNENSDENDLEKDPEIEEPDNEEEIEPNENEDPNNNLRIKEILFENFSGLKNAIKRLFTDIESVIHIVKSYDSNNDNHNLENTVDGISEKGYDILNKIQTLQNGVILNISNDKLKIIYNELENQVSDIIKEYSNKVDVKLKNKY
ncbi:hypothetical protein FPHOBKDP_00139 [Listeria phage LPJP1]|nr:hypothetical protein FPHOBKDP_00139 [Listeria phage LPJP1]